MAAGRQTLNSTAHGMEAGEVFSSTADGGHTGKLQTAQHMAAGAVLT
jgi:hypothetical protein